MTAWLRSVAAAMGLVVAMVSILQSGIVLFMTFSALADDNVFRHHQLVTLVVEFVWVCTVMGTVHYIVEGGDSE